MTIDILLASCNSERFLREQLDSILAQDAGEDFRVLIRDDNSVDSTPEIIREYCTRHPGRVEFRETGKPGGSALGNFAALLDCAEGELVMFADHDDVWKPDKIRVSMAKYREMAGRYGENTPLLVFTDTAIADEMLRPVAESGFRYQHIDPERLALRQLLLQNVPSGNTMLFNRALLELARPVSPGAVMHDHWVALTASVFGRIGYVRQPTLLYRQHNDNVYGAFHYSLPSFCRKLTEGRRLIRERFYRNVCQAGAFLEHHREKLDPAATAMLGDFSRFPEMGFFEKRLCLIRHGIWKTGLIRNIGMLLLA